MYELLSNVTRTEIQSFLISCCIKSVFPLFPSSWGQRSFALKLTQEPVTVNGSPAVSRPERSSKRTARRYQYRSSGKLCAWTKGTAGSVSTENRITITMEYLSTCQTRAILKWDLDLHQNKHTSRWGGWGHGVFIMCFSKIKAEKHKG